MRQRPLKMDAWGISFDAYKELYHFCQQYSEKKRRADDLLTLPGSALRVERMPGSDEGCIMPRGGGVSDPVVEVAMRREALLADCKMIEQAAIEADGELYPYILRAVTTRDGARAVRAPCGERYFRNVRKKFFYLLWCKRENVPF
jgi:hypothetical protein